MKRFVLLCALAACPSKQPASTTPAPAGDPGAAPASLDGQMDRLRAMMQDSADQVLAAEGCDGRAAVMDAWLAANGAEVREIIESLDAYPREEVQRKAEAMFSPDDPTAQQLADVQAECEEDGAFRDAWDRMATAFEPEWADEMPPADDDVGP